MPKSLRKRSLYHVMLFLALFLGVTILNAQVILSDSPNAFSIEDDSFSGITVHNTFGSFNTIDVSTSEGVFTEAGANSYVSTQETGLPKLPVKRKLISIPVGATPEVEILSATIQEYKLSDLGIHNRLFPAQPPVPKNGSKIEFVFNSAAYSQDKYYGSEPVNVEILGFLRDTRIARLDISPVSYNPVSGKIRVYKELVVRINFTGGDAEATYNLTKKTASPYFSRLGSMMGNRLLVMSEREDIIQYPVKMVIVSDPMFQQALQPYIAWKVKKGFTIIEAYTNNPAVGNTTSSIKNYLQSLYNAGTPEDPSPSFVLFVGDVGQIPVFNTEHVTDLYYCEFTNDYFPEMYYGRFSATSVAQLQPQIDKTLMYEQYLFPDPSFLGECVMVSGVDANFAPVHGNGQINYGTTYYFNQAHGLLSHTYLYPESGSSGSQIIQNVSDGVGFANYTAHGSASGWADPSFSIYDIPGLQNDGEYPLMIGNCCQTSMYGTNCFAEELLRAENKGAVGYIGASNNTYWDEDFYFGVGVGQITSTPTYEETSLGSYDRAFHDHGEPYADWYTTMDQLIFSGNLAATEGSPGMAEYYWEIYCLMGDPSLSIYNSGIPSPMAVTHEPLLPPNSTEFTVNCAPYAYVAISKEGVLYGAALADENGVAVVNLNPITNPGIADIVVTAQNKQPYSGTVIVASPDGPFVILQSQTVNDRSGNNNLQADYNESFGFDMTLKNVGSEDAQNVNVTLSTPSPYLTVKTAIEEWGTIMAGDTASLNMAFELTASEWLPDQVIAPVNLTISDGTDIWNSSFNLVLNAPLLQVEGLTIDDSQSSNSNGRLDSGETVIITVPVANQGHSDAYEDITYLFCENQGVIISSKTYSIGDLTSGSTQAASYEVTLADTVSSGTWLNFFISTNAEPYYSTSHYLLPVNQVIEGFETGDFTAFSWQNNSSQPWTINPMTHNSGLYSARSGVIPNNSVTELSIEMDVPADDILSFARKVTSEEDYDFLSFYIDGALIDSWSGEVPWGTVSYNVSAGTHTFKWEYSKDYSDISGGDAAFIDDIVFPTGYNTSPSAEFEVHTFSYPDQACNSQDINLFAFVINNPNPVTYQWLPSEVLNSDAVYNPVANLTETTEFTANIFSGFTSVSDIISIQVNELPSSPVITLADGILTSSEPDGNQWYNSTGPIEGATQQSYEPTVSDFYHSTVTSAAGCESPASNEIWVEVVSVSDKEKNSLLKIYPNPFRNYFEIVYNLTSGGMVDIRLIDPLGREMDVLVNQTIFSSGNHKILYLARDLQPGMYFIRYEVADEVHFYKLIMNE